MSKYDVVTIIEKRDGISRTEALEAVEDTINMIRDVLRDEDSIYIAYEEITEILREELGLEPDYLEDLLDYN